MIDAPILTGTDLQLFTFLKVSQRKDLGMSSQKLTTVMGSREDDRKNEVKVQPIERGVHTFVDFDFTVMIFHLVSSIFIISTQRKT